MSVGFKGQWLEIYVPLHVHIPVRISLFPPSLSSLSVDLYSLSYLFSLSLSLSLSLLTNLGNLVDSDVWVRSTGRDAWEYGC